MKNGETRNRGSERRSSPRARDVGLRATVIARGKAPAPLDVSDLSAGGARLVGSSTLAVGEQIQLLLETAAGAHPIALLARVLRIEPSETSGQVAVAVAFTSVPGAIQDVIQGLVLRALERKHREAAHTVLVVDDAQDVCAALARDVRSLGLGAVTARTPLDAVRCIEDPAVGIKAALVDLRLGTADGTDVLAYLADEHPRVRRVVVSGAEPAVLEHEVHCGRADAFITKPWDRTELARALRG